MRRLSGSGENLRARRLFDSSAKSSTSINVIPTFHEEELRFCVCHAPRRNTDAKPDARQTLDERRRDEDAVMYCISIPFFTIFDQKL